MNELTRILSAMEQGDAQASEQLLPLVYEELRKLAAAKLAQEKPGQTLEATALVHEAYVRLVGVDQAPQWDNRGHFFAAAAEAMRRILVEQARRRHAAKRGGDRHRVDLSESSLLAPMPDDELLSLNDALEEFATLDPTSANLVRLRFFAGLTMAETAKILGMSVRTAHDHWAYARSWLRRRLHSD